MYEISKECFGAFVASKRKLLGLTQAELAQRLNVSNKAVSKWETGVSLPDVGILMPLAEELGVTVTELLQGREIPMETPMDSEHVEELVQSALHYQVRDPFAQGRSRRAGIYFGCILLALLEGLAIHSLVTPIGSWTAFAYLSYIFGIVFGGFFLFLVKPLPPYYDQHKIQGIYQGFFRMNVPGLYFNNRNWPHIVRVGQIWSMGMLVGYPLVYGLMTLLFPEAWLWLELGLVMPVILLSLFVPMYAVGKKYA